MAFSAALQPSGMEHLIARPERNDATRKIYDAHHGLSTAIPNKYRKRCLVSASDGDGRNLTEKLVASLTTTSHALMETCGSL